MKKEFEKIIEVKSVKKIYRMGNERITAVEDVSFNILKGEFCCLLGTSGSGKSTLLNLMAGIEKASGGQIIIKGKNIHKMSEKNLARFRQRYLGFVFQSYNLINSMNALENVEFPLIFKKVGAKKRKKMARDVLIKVGLGNRIKHKPKEMSGGQQQRVGIARAFVAKPEIVFADEPTGNLDTRTTMEVMDLIKGIARDNKQTIVMVTHDRRLAGYADKIIHILDGRIQNVEILNDITVEGAQQVTGGHLLEEDAAEQEAAAAKAKAAAAKAVEDSIEADLAAEVSEIQAFEQQASEAEDSEVSTTQEVADSQSREAAAKSSTDETKQQEELGVSINLAKKDITEDSNVKPQAASGNNQVKQKKKEFKK